MTGNRPPHPDALPGYENAVIPAGKLERYALDPSHVWGKNRGADKARVFSSALGFDQSNWEVLRQRILEELPYSPASLKGEDHYGRRYSVVLPITGPNGKTADVITGWIIRPGVDYPILTTARVDTGKV